MDNKDLMSVIGSVVGHIVRLGPDALYEAEISDLLEIIPREVDPAKRSGMLEATLSILEALGLVRVETGRVGPLSRNAYFALASLTKYLSAGTPVVELPVNNEQKDYLINLTLALEQMRGARREVNSDPIHSRRIVNILVKSRQNRKGAKQDVYLHVYHRDWQAYHLVGISQKKETESDQYLVELAMKQHLNLSEREYEVDHTFNPPEVSLQAISATSGALTDYTYRVYRIKGFRNRLALSELIEREKEEADRNYRQPRFDRDSFRWFTLEEIRRSRGMYGERIMFSSASLFDELNLESTTVNAPDADDIRLHISVVAELGNRITYLSAFAAIAVIVIGLSLLFFSTQILNYLGTQNVLLDNAVKLIGLGFSGVSAYSAYRRLRY